MNIKTEVFLKIKELSKRTLNSNHRIFVIDIAGALSCSKESLLISLNELENDGLIKIHKTTVTAISLTSYGMLQKGNLY